jgi:hypothetical protein
MGKIELFTMCLESLQAVYMTGETIKGDLLVRINERLKINSISISLKGESRVHWTESYYYKKRNHMVYYHAKDDYLHHNDIVLLTTTDENQDLYIEVGEHSYPFQIQLPQDLPTSFEHVHGRIRYSLNGRIDIPMTFEHKHVSLSITVISPLDLNLRPLLRQPATIQDIKTICCWCCKSDPIRATLSIFKGGYVSGEGLAFNAIIENRSSRAIKSLSFKIMQDVNLHASAKSRTISRVVAQIFYPKIIEKNSCEEWSNTVLTIPSVCASLSNTCRIIDVYYYALLSVCPEGPSLSFDLSIPITIGTIPLIDGKMVKFTHSFEACTFKTTPNKELDDKKDGEVTNYMNPHFSPHYHFYQALKVGKK